MIISLWWCFLLQVVLIAIFSTEILETEEKRGQGESPEAGLAALQAWVFFFCWKTSNCRVAVYYGIPVDVTKDSHFMVICFAPLTFWHSLHWARACLLSTPLTPCLGCLSSSSVELLKASGEAVNAKEDELKANGCGCSKVCAQGISVFCCFCYCMKHKCSTFRYTLSGHKCAWNPRRPRRGSLSCRSDFGSGSSSKRNRCADGSSASFEGQGKAQVSPVDMCSMHKTKSCAVFGKTLKRTLEWKKIAKKKGSKKWRIRCNICMFLALQRYLGHVHELLSFWYTSSSAS